jgi:hypothetical protein
MSAQALGAEVAEQREQDLTDSVAAEHGVEQRVEMMSVTSAM